jgi:hypothetical protein
VLTDLATKPVRTGTVFGVSANGHREACLSNRNSTHVQICYELYERQLTGVRKFISADRTEYLRRSHNGESLSSSHRHECRSGWQHIRRLLFMHELMQQD